MKEFIKGSVEHKVFYEISEDELNEIKINERGKGRCDVANYILYAYNNYIYKMNIGGICDFCKNVITFCSEGKKINGCKGYDFFDFVEKFRR